MGLARAGTFPFFNFIYREEDWKTYLPNKTLNEYTAVTSKLSDHLPLWVELFVDFGGPYL